jgi:hypothetical protein
MRAVTVAVLLSSGLWSGYLAACSGSKTQAPSAVRSGPPAQLIATAASAADVQVATVNGRPVFASCVTTQAARGASKQEALDQCIGFELLAQKAESYATDPEVVLETHTALVNQLIARDYEDKLTKPSDFGAFWNQALARNKNAIEHGEARASAYVRISVPKDAPPEEDAKARALVEEIAKATVNERGLTPIHLKDIGERIVAGRAKLDFAVVASYLDNGGLNPTYAQPLFAIREVGRTSGAVRTYWGWDVILLSDVVPAEKLSPDEIVVKVLPDVKRSYFSFWVSQIAAKSSVTVFDKNLPLLEDL